MPYNGQGRCICPQPRLVVAPQARQVEVQPQPLDQSQQLAEAACDQVYAAVTNKITSRMAVFRTAPWRVMAWVGVSAIPARRYTSSFIAGLAVAMTCSPTTRSLTPPPWRGPPSILGYGPPAPHRRPPRWPWPHPATRGNRTP